VAHPLRRGKEITHCAVRKSFLTSYVFGAEAIIQHWLWKTLKNATQSFGPLLQVFATDYDATTACGARTSAKGAHARSAGARASASTSAKGASARSAARRRTRRCRPAWRSSRVQRMLLVKTCDLSHGPHVTVGRRQTSVQSLTPTTQKCARSAGRRASARTSAEGAYARSAARRQTFLCRPAWRCSLGQRMLLVKTCDLSHGPHVTDPKQSLIAGAPQTPPPPPPPRGRLSFS
jgi:hypothetical protein